MLVEGRSAFVIIYDFKDGEGALQVLNTDPGAVAVCGSLPKQTYAVVSARLVFPGISGPVAWLDLRPERC